MAEDYAAIECPVMAVGGWADAYTNAVPRLLAHLRVPRLGLIGPWGHMMPYEGVPGPAMDFLQRSRALVGPVAEGHRHGDHGGAAAARLDAGLCRSGHLLRERPGRWIGEALVAPEDVGRLSLAWARRHLVRAAARRSTRDAARPPAAAVPQTGRSAGSGVRGYRRCVVRERLAGRDRRRPDGPTTPARSASRPEPLAEPLEVLGFPCRLRLSADRPLALVAARLEDVAPDGSSLLVSWGMLNLTHRVGTSEPSRWSRAVV